MSEISYYVNEVSNLEMRFTEFQSTLLDMFEELVYNGIRVILCLDEFDYCKNYLEECHFQLLRELSYRPENKIAIVTASRRSIHDIEKDSGGGSNFFETFKKIYLKPFSIEDIRLQRNLIDGVSENDCILLDKAVGRHPYLNAIILDEFFNTRDMKSSIDKQINSVLTHYDYLFRILKKDKLDDKVVKLYSGFQILYPRRRKNISTTGMESSTTLETTNTCRFAIHSSSILANCIGQIHTTYYGGKLNEVCEP